MLPLSLVENQSFKEFINYLHPSFKMPTRKTVKSTCVPTLKECVIIIMKNLITEIEYPNISDGWSDSTARPFNGYVCQGIDSYWNLLSLPIEFKHMKGKIKYV